MFMNEKYCKPTHISVKGKLCSKDAEILAISLRPYYLPREIYSIRLFIVYIPPAADTKVASELIHGFVIQAETESPESAKFILGDFNSCGLTSDSLPNYHQYVDCPTRQNSCIDLCYGNIKGAYCARGLAGLGCSDHNMIHLLPLYKPRVRTVPARRINIKTWTAAATQMLQDCFPCTDWDLLINTAENLNDAVNVVSDYVQFCKDTIIPTKTVRVLLITNHGLLKN